MIGGDHDQGLLEHSELVELVEESTDVVVGVADSGVVAVEGPPHVVHRGEVERLA